MRGSIGLFFLSSSTLLTTFRFSLAQSESVDLTLVFGSVGIDVVEASIRKLSCLHVIFENDFGFLKRIALVESNYGRNQSSMPIESFGGIWQISREMFEYVLSHDRFFPTLQSATEVIGTIAGKSGLFDTRVPILSAFLARLFIKFQLEDNAINFPQNISGQASWWSTYYNINGSKERFIDDVETYEEANKCNASLLDIWFLLDRSSSLNLEDFNASLNFVTQLSSQFPISENQVRTGLSLFSKGIRVISRFHQHQSNVAFENAIKDVPIMSSVGTRAGNALRHALQRGFRVSTGARPPSEGVPRILIMLTDGISQDSVIEPSEDLKAAGVTIFAIGIGDGIDDNELRLIASDPDTEYAYTFDNFDNLVSLFGDRLTRLSCEVPRIIPNDTTVEVRLIPGSPTYGVVRTRNYDMNGELHVTISTNTPNVSGIIFVSSSFPNPNAALHDFSIPIETGISTTTFQILENTRRKNASQLYFTFLPNGSTPFVTQINVIGDQIPSVPAPRVDTTRRELSTLPSTTTEQYKKATTSKPKLSTLFSTTIGQYEEETTSRPTIEEETSSRPTIEEATTSRPTIEEETTSRPTIEEKSCPPPVVVIKEVPLRYIPIFIPVPAEVNETVNGVNSNSSAINVSCPSFQLLVCALVSLICMF